MMENIENNKKSTLTVYDDGDKYWHKNDQVHREDGPAVEYDNGDKLWYLNNKLHREDGPAVEFANGHKNWYFNGEEIKVKNNEEFLRIMKIKAFL